LLLLLLLLLSRRILMRMHLSAAECSLVLVNWKRKKRESSANYIQVL
jgi:hypothetical protein